MWLEQNTLAAFNLNGVKYVSSSELLKATKSESIYRSGRGNGSVDKVFCEPHGGINTSLYNYLYYIYLSL